MSEIHEFVLRGGQMITVGQMQAFQRKLPFLKVKAETMETDEFPHLSEQTRFLVRYLEDVLENVYASEDLPAVAEAVFALGYLLKDVDIIPDTIPGAGYADDSAVLRAVLESHVPEFRAFAKAAQLDFDKLSLSA